MKTLGIDIGSTCAKTVVLDENKNILHRLLQPTGWSSVDTAEAIHTKLSELGVDWEQAAVVATGYGRISVPYADKSVTEITCHGRDRYRRAGHQADLRGGRHGERLHYE